MFKPFGDYIAIKPDEKEQVTQSGIVLPDDPDEEPLYTGTVMALGAVEGLKPGDRVIFRTHGFHEVAYEGESLKLFKPEGILAVL